MTIKALLFDLDGTVYRGTEAVPGAADFISALDLPYLFVTNRGNRTPEAVAEQLRDMGIKCGTENVLTSSQAVAQYLGAGLRVFCVGEEGLKVALRKQGAVIVGPDEATPDAVVVSFDRDFDYDKLTSALRYIKAGARFVATNDDQVITTESGLVPEAGPLVAAVETATGQVPEIVGKPHAPIMETALAHLGIAPQDAVIIGDNLLTDILAGHNAGMPSALILTGVSTAMEAVKCKVPPTWVVQDYKELKATLNL